MKRSSANSHAEDTTSPTDEPTRQPERLSRLDSSVKKERLYDITTRNEISIYEQGRNSLLGKSLH